MNIKKIISIFTSLTIAVSASLFTFSDKADNADVTFAVSETDGLIDELMSLINDARTELGAEPLAIDPYISDIALTRAEEQTETVGHIRPDGTMWDTVIDKDILGYGETAENLIYGTIAGSAKIAFQAWKNSEIHWTNITNPAYKYTGVGIVHDPDSEYGWYWVQIFSSTTSGQQSSAPEYDIDTLKSNMADKINAERKANGLEPLEINPYLSECADKRSEELTRNFSHTRPDGSSYVTVIDENILKWSALNESCVSAVNPEDAFDILKISQKDKENMLNCTYTDIGIGLINNTNGEWYWTVIYYTNKVIHGDLNSDGRIDLFDYILILKLINRNSETAVFSDVKTEFADCFADGIITEADAKVLMKYILSEQKSLPYRT